MKLYERYREWRFTRALRIARRWPVAAIGRGGNTWWVPAGVLDAASIVYSGGIGEDAAFELELIDRLGCDVWAFDPTPKAAAYVESQVETDRFHFLPVGLWSTEARKFFHEPADTRHASHSVVNLHRTQGGFEAPCRSLDSLARQLGHSRIDLLKLDIEGAEYAVLDAFFEAGHRPRVLLVEFHEGRGLPVPSDFARGLRDRGYEIVAVDGFAVTFLRP
jgi:FkbM family methyltransferase